MSGDSCNCGGNVDEREATTDSATDDWLPGDDVLDAELPREVRTGLGDLLGQEPVATLGEWVEVVRRETAGGSIAVGDLCHADEETAHWGEMDGDRYHFRCFYDAVVLSALAAEPVTVHTESPDGRAVEVRAMGTEELTVTPETAVFSFGVSTSAGSATEDNPTHADVYDAVCPYVRAFPTRTAYEDWAEGVSAATVGMPLAGGTDLATALVE